MKHNVSLTGKPVGMGVPPGAVVPTEFEWDRAEPLAITIHFITTAGRNTWKGGRELFWKGLDEDCRDEQLDIGIWPTLGGFTLSLNSPFGQAEFFYPDAGELRDMLNNTYTIVPSQAEDDYLELALDDMLEIILSSAGDDK